MIGILLFSYLFSIHRRRDYIRIIYFWVEGGGGGVMTIFHHNTIAQILFHLQFISLAKLL